MTNEESIIKAMRLRARGDAVAGIVFLSAVGLFGFLAGQSVGFAQAEAVVKSPEVQQCVQELKEGGYVRTR